MKTLITTVVAGLATATMAYAECGKVSIAEMDWQSAEWIANVDALVLEHGFGCEVDLVPGGTSPILTSMVEKGTPDIAPELYYQSGKDLIEKAIEEKRLLILNPEPFSNVVEGWYIPQYIADAHPELKTIEDVLARPDLFPHPENPEKGGFYTCPSGWSCARVNANLFKAFGAEEKGWELVDPGSGAALAGAITKANLSQQPIFFWYWNPTVILARHESKPLDWGVPHDAEEWANCTIKGFEECENPKPNAWSKPEAVTLVTQKLVGTEIGNYLKIRKFEESVFNKYLVHGDDNQMSGKDLAIYFLVNEQELLSSWLGNDIAQKIINKLK